MLHIAIIIIMTLTTKPILISLYFPLCVVSTNNSLFITIIKILFL